MKTNDKTTSTFAMLDNGRQSTYKREDFAKKLKLKGYYRTINISSVKDKPENVKVNEIRLKIYDVDHKNEAKVGAYTLPK